MKEIKDYYYCTKCRTVDKVVFRIKQFNDGQHIGMYCRNGHWIKWISKDNSIDRVVLKEESKQLF